MKTRTGTLPIGFRRGGGWQRDLAALAAWAAETGFERLDLQRGATAADIETVRQAGLDIGSVDLPDWGGLLSADAGKRAATVDANVAHVREMASLDVFIHFLVVLPDADERDTPRVDLMARAVESLGAVGAVLEEVGGKAVIEGWPGPAPQYPALCCTPETLRHLFEETGSPALGVNYDPSHLIRLGVDHVRFAEEFADRVFHVHAKDTEIYPEAAYEYGLYQPGAFEKGHRWGGHAWRYTLPGLGATRWTRVFEILAAAGYTGALCVELEDENFNGSEDGEKSALEMSLAFLQRC